MNRRLNFCICKWVMTAGLLAALISGLPLAAAPVEPEAVSRSVFTLPTNPTEGRDPFFPESTRLYAAYLAKLVKDENKPRVGDLSSLVLKGISGTANNRLAIINNHTLGIGDEQDIATPQGRIHIRCVEIKDDSVVVESAGQRHELKYNAAQ